MEASLKTDTSHFHSLLPYHYRTRNKAKKTENLNSKRHKVHDKSLKHDEVSANLDGVFLLYNEVLPHTRYTSTQNCHLRGENRSSKSFQTKAHLET